MLEAAGYPEKKGALAAVSKSQQVPHSTLSRWARNLQNPPPSQLVHEKKIDLLAELENLLELHIRAAGETIKDAYHNQVMQGLGITFDKIQLLTGGATENVNQQVKFINVNRPTD